MKHYKAETRIGWNKRHEFTALGSKNLTRPQRNNVRAVLHCVGVNITIGQIPSDYHECVEFILGYVDAYKDNAKETKEVLQKVWITDHEGKSKLVQRYSWQDRIADIAKHNAKVSRQYRSTDHDLNTALQELSALHHDQQTRNIQTRITNGEDHI